MLTFKRSYWNVSHKCIELMWGIFVLVSTTSQTYSYSKWYISITYIDNYNNCLTQLKLFVFFKKSTNEIACFLVFRTRLISGTNDQLQTRAFVHARAGTLPKQTYKYSPMLCFSLYWPVLCFRGGTNDGGNWWHLFIKFPTSEIADYRLWLINCGWSCLFPLQDLSSPRSFLPKMIYGHFGKIPPEQEQKYPSKLAIRNYSQINKLSKKK